MEHKENEIGRKEQDLGRIFSVEKKEEGERQRKEEGGKEKKEERGRERKSYMRQNKYKQKREWEEMDWRIFIDFLSLSLSRYIILCLSSM